MLIVKCSNDSSTPKLEHENLPSDIVEMNEEQCFSADIKFGSIEKRSIGNTINVTGLVTVPPKNSLSVSAAMGGYVKSTELFEGCYVKKGQILVILENPEFIELQQGYLENKIKLDFAEQDFNRQKELYNNNVNTAKTYQQAVADYKSLKSKVAAIDKKLKLIGIDAKKLTDDNISETVTVNSAIDGYIKSININNGKYVSPTDIMFEIVNNENMILEVTVFEKDIDKIEIGQNINFSSQNNSNELQKAKVFQIGKALSTDKSIKVYASCENKNKNILPGMIVNATIEVNNSIAECVPDEAVVNFEDKDYIFVFSKDDVENNKKITLFKIVEIKKGVSANGYTEISFVTNSNYATSKIVIKGAYNLLSALKNGGEMAC